MSTALATMTTKLAQRLDMGVDGSSLVDTLKATAFKGQVTDAQMVALLVVANQYALNPWTKEIYAFPDRNNGIIPVVGVDGWSRIINSNEAFDGMDFTQDDESCTCIIYRKDRTHPIKVTEYMSECKRTGQGPWQSHPKRMLRHKAMIQCARIAFGYVGIYDPDEAERISEGPTPPTVDLSDDLSRIRSAPTLQDLQSVFSDCWKANTGKAERDALTKAKDERKTQLTSNVVEVSDAAA
jgi:phage recombination protein Bet